MTSRYEPRRSSPRGPGAVRCAEAIMAGLYLGGRTSGSSLRPALDDPLVCVATATDRHCQRVRRRRAIDEELPVAGIVTQRRFEGDGDVALVVEPIGEAIRRNR